MLWQAVTQKSDLVVQRTSLWMADSDDDAKDVILRE
jgi:hypothetical protein